MVPQTARESLRRWDPERIGSYTILGRLGSGAMGQVYLGRSGAGRLVAVKTIKIELAEEAGFRRHFAQEVAAARRVSGVFTAAVIEADPEADVPWLATAYVPAPSLNRLVQTCGPLPVRTVRWLAAGCAEALASIHSAGLVHRDLKPSNVLVAPGGPRVIDFGVARPAERIELTVARGTVGTPAYMAPEQARDTGQATIASDVFSLGATLVFAATAHPPYQGETVMDILVRLATEPPDLSELPEELDGLIRACMQRVPRQRPAWTTLLAQLGPFTETSDDPSQEHSYLSDDALALIAEYRRNPPYDLRADAEGSSEGEDQTSASYTALPAAFRPPPPRPRSQRRRTTLVWTGWTGAAVALMGAGTVLGLSLSGSSTPVTSTGGAAAGGPPPALPSCAPPGAPGGAGGPPPGASPGGPPAGQSGGGQGGGQGGPPQVCMRNANGFPDTGFVVEGIGFAPRTHVDISLTGVGPPPDALPIPMGTGASEVTVGSQGTFSFPVNADHRLLRGDYPLGLYTVTATDDGQPVTTQFRVIPGS